MLLKKLNLIQYKEFEIDISKEDFVEYLEHNIGEKEDLSIFSKPKSIYSGHCNYSNFEITENPQMFKKTSDAKIKGTISYQNNGIKIKIESYLTSPGGLILVATGVIMILIGLFNLIDSRKIINEEVLVPLLLGISFLTIMYLNTKREPIIAAKNFEKRLCEIKKRHHNTM